MDCYINHIAPWADVNLELIGNFKLTIVQIIEMQKKLMETRLLIAENGYDQWLYDCCFSVQILKGHHHKRSIKVFSAA
jgi:hypothetical protein